MPLEFDWVDAFSVRPFGGNGCAVVYDAAGLNDETCMAIVRETSLVECTFLGPSERADVRVRYFLANTEIPFAGHPTLATVASLADRGRIAGGKVVLETGAGLIPVELGGDAGGERLITMRQARPVFHGPVPAEIVAPVVGLKPEDIMHPPQIVSTGLPFCITVLKDHDALRRAHLDAAALEAFRAASGVADARVMEPFLVTLQGVSEDAATFARLLLAPPMPPEDPFTGSATGAMAAYLWAEGLLERPRFVAEQGHWMGRPGRAQVKVLGPRDDIDGVKVGGQGYVLMRGYLNL